VLYLIPLMPLFGAAFAGVAQRHHRQGAAWLAAACASVSLGLLLTNLDSVLAGVPAMTSMPWMPALGLTLSFWVDGLSFLFALLVLVIGLLVILYAVYYLEPEEPLGRFYGFLMLFMGAMLGLALASNLILILVFWELTSLSSFLLIGFWKHRTDARQGARQALMITGGGGLALLAGILMIGHIVGSFELPVVLAAGDLIRDHSLYPVALVLVLLGAFTKSAQFPFHYWLPHAMAAPTPVSAYLHSATMVKAGVFLLARLFPALAGTDLWFFLVGGTGLITLLFGAYTALFQHDLKGLLAYSTISHLGLITLLLGMGTPLGEVAAVFHIINHATFKASLFMATGIIDHETGTRDMRKLNGMFRYLPHTAVLAMTAAAAMAGVPLLNGFLSKEMFFGETLHVDLLGASHWVLPTLATLAGALAVAYSTRFIHDVFFNGDPIDLPKQPHEPPRWMKVPVEILVIICVLVGLFPQYTVQWLLQATVRDVLGQSVPDYSLALWHGFNLPLLMSVIALAGGVALYAVRHRLFALHARLFPEISAKDLTEDRLGRLLLWSRRGTDRFENGSLQRYLYLLVAIACVATVLPFFGPGEVLSPLTHPFDLISVVPLALIVLGAVGTVIMHRRRYLALIPLSLVGLAVSMVFARFSAPDLALTQILVEVATVILMLLALYFLPQHAAPTASVGRVWRDRLLALVVGVGMSALCYLTLTQSPKALSQFFLDNAVPGGGGANVVNVILVDFRGFDTFGESVVLAIAAVGIFAMLRDLSLKGPTLDDCGRPWDTDRHPIVLAMVSRPLLPLALMVAVYLLLRGHNAPGGGFIGGLVAGSALILQYMANGMRWASDRLPTDMRPMVAIGLLIATATGVASWVFDAPFLTSTYAHVHLPWIGEFELASAMAFDLGVFMVVVGTVLLILTRLGAQSGDAPKRADPPPMEDIGP